MKYHYEASDSIKHTKYLYKCDHSLYSSCTLFRDEDNSENGLAVVRLYFNPRLKVFWYGAIDSGLADDIADYPGFKDYVSKHSGECTDGLYPTVNVRQIMWALRMKPLKREEWESQKFQSL